MKVKMLLPVVVGSALVTSGTAAETRQPLREVGGAPAVGNIGKAGQPTSGGAAATASGSTTVSVSGRRASMRSTRSGWLLQPAVTAIVAMVAGRPLRAADGLPACGNLVTPSKSASMNVSREAALRLEGKCR